MAVRSRFVGAVIGVVLLGIALSGCDLANGPATPDLTTADVLYLTELRLADVEFDSADTSIAHMTTGRNACSLLNKNKSVPATAKTLLTDSHPDHASVIIVAAIHNYCPQHNTLLAVPGRN